MSELKAVAALTQIPGVAQNYLPQDAKPVAFGSAEDFSSSDDPHCKNGGKACIDCLMRGECLHQTVEPVPEAAQEPMFWVRLTDSGGYEGPLHRSSIEDAHKKSGAWTPLYTEPQPPAEVQPTHTDMELAELILSDCGISTDNTNLLNRVAIRICKHWAVVLDDKDESPEHIPDATKTESAFAFIGAIYSNGKHGVIVRYNPSGYFLEQYPYNGLVYAPWFASLRDVGAFLVDHGFARTKEPATQGQPIEVQHLPADDTEGGAV